MKEYYIATTVLRHLSDQNGEKVVVYDDGIIGLLPVFIDEEKAKEFIKYIPGAAIIVAVM